MPLLHPPKEEEQQKHMSVRCIGGFDQLSVYSCPISHFRLSESWKTLIVLEINLNMLENIVLQKLARPVLWSCNPDTGYEPQLHQEEHKKYLYFF